MLTYIIVAGCLEITTVALISALDSCRRMLQHQLSKPGYVGKQGKPGQEGARPLDPRQIICTRSQSCISLEDPIRSAVQRDPACRFMITLRTHAMSLTASGKKSKKSDFL